jgi:hypothetical protein
MKIKAGSCVFVALMLIGTVRVFAGQWVIETVDSAGQVGGFTSLAFDSSGHPAISYFDYSNQNLKYAHYNGSSWVIETVDSAGHVGEYTSLAFDSSGNVGISYYDLSNDDLEYVCSDGFLWCMGMVDSAGDVGRYTSLAFDSSGHPAISYYDDSNGDLKYARHSILPSPGYLSPGYLLLLLLEP